MENRCSWVAASSGKIHSQLYFSPLSLCYWQSLSYCTAEQESQQDMETEKERTRKIRETLSLSRELLSIQEQGKSIRENYEPSKYALQNEPCGDIEEEQGGHRHWKESFARSSQYSQLRMVGNESECEFSSVVVEEWEGV